ncbi:MAG: hypothetical protein R2939_07160 [Kofleriaceae bacterium]
MYRLLASLHERTGAPERALRVLEVMAQLGFAEPHDEATAGRLRAAHPTSPPRGELDDELRTHGLLTAGARGPLGELWAAAPAALAQRLPAPRGGERIAPISTVSDRAARAIVAEVAATWGSAAEVYVGDRVPGLVTLISHPRPLFIFDRTLLIEPADGLRYLVGWALEALRGGYAPLLALGARARAELVTTLGELVGDELERSAPVRDLARALPPRAAERLAAIAGRGLELDVDAWLDDMAACARRAGLVACGSLAAASEMIARLAGEPPAVDDEVAAVVGLRVPGPDLVRYYLSDEFHQLRRELGAR